MSIRRASTPVALFLACAIGGLWVARAWPTQDDVAAQPSETAASPAQALGGWLLLSPDQLRDVEGVDPTFAADSQRLQSELSAARQTLADLFDDPATDGTRILDQVEIVIAKHDALERRVAEYLVAIRPHLTDRQRARLFERCAEGVREAGGWQWRHGRDASNGPEAGRGRGYGRNRQNGNARHDRQRDTQQGDKP